MLKNGQGGPQNYLEAARWYQESATQGNLDAQNNLGYLYEHGLGVPQDSVQAYAWYSVAAAHEHEIAVKNRDSVGGRMTGGQLAIAQSLSEDILATLLERDRQH